MAELVRLWETHPYQGWVIFFVITLIMLTWAGRSRND